MLYNQAGTFTNERISMSVTVVVGLQWGDEGKGKVVDLLAQDADIVIRSTGGNNAGHSIINEHGKFVLHLVPAGIFNPNTWNVIERGVVIHPPSLMKEMQELRSKKVSFDRLMISPDAHLVMPWHIAEEYARKEEQQKYGVGVEIGTTLRGIGPAYQHKAGRTEAFTVADLISRDQFIQKLEKIGAPILAWLKIRYPNADTLARLTLDVIRDEYLEAREYIAPNIRNTRQFIRSALMSDLPILLEGSQGTLLDPDFGTYPFVTSSGVTASAMCMYSGVLPQYVSRVVGVAKAYITRVGEGPFPTEMAPEDGFRIRELGKEFGATTGRPRRCGWLDMALLRYACEVNDINEKLEIAFTKMDILGKLEHVKLGLYYENSGNHFDVRSLDSETPVYAMLRGWGDLHRIRSHDLLPRDAHAYLWEMRQHGGLCWPINYISVGPERDQTILSVGA
ncbi:MAG: adenylosuccinate synthase [bacterium]|nr:adenylosuccinate synthase [bacterium]